MRIGFVRSRKGYPSYGDFWRLVEISSFEWAWADEANLDDQDRLWIWPTMNMEFMGRLRALGHRRKARVAWWYLERPDANTPGADGVALFRAAISEALLWIDAVWVSDRHLAGLDLRTFYVCLGSHPDFGVAFSEEKRWDIAFMGQRTPRRSWTLAALERRGLSVTPESSGDERARAFAAARLALAVDRTPGMKIVTPLRWAVAAAYRLGIIQERLPDPYPLVDGRSVAMAALEVLPDMAAHLVRSGEWQALGLGAHDILCRERPFRTNVERSAEELVALFERRSLT